MASGLSPSLRWCLLLVAGLLVACDAELPNPREDFSGVGDSEFNLTSWLQWRPRLGHVGFAVTAHNQLAKRLFDLGLRLIYNFDQPNAQLVLKEAVRADDTCAMCLWALAHSYGPFLNAVRKSAEELRSGWAFARQAARLLDLSPSNYTAKEAVLVRSMAARYPEPGSTTQQEESYKAYASVLRQLRRDHKLLDDPDLKVFEAEALMLLRAPHFYVPRGDSLPPAALPETVESTQLLREVLSATKQAHPYAQHLLIHSTEQSNADAVSALESAGHLLNDTAMLQDQHLQHMSSHTYLRTGHYHEGLLANIVAVGSDSSYLRHDWMPNGPGHDSAFLVACALWAGERAAAYKYVQVMQQVFERVPGAADYPDGSMAWNYPMVVALRFGDWARVAELERPAPRGYAGKWLYGGLLLSHFSHAVAEVHLGRLDWAAHRLAKLRILLPSASAPNDQNGNLSKIANHTASAVLAMAQGASEAAVAALAEAVDLEMALPYSMPPSWLLPTRECYGHALFLTGQLQKAEAVFRAALRGQSFHAEPHCGWALLGLRRSLQARGGKDGEIKALGREIQAAWRHADVPLRSPCALMDIGREGRPLLL